MLRMGKNPKTDQTESEHMSDNPATQYNTSQQPHTPYPQPADSQYRPMPDSSSTSRPVTESESLARDIKEGIMTGFVGNGTTLKGEANFKGMLRVDGVLAGHVKSDGGTLIVGNNGQVDGEIAVAVATIQGTVNGNITASQRLELGRAAKVKGDIETPSLIIEQGAVYEGTCRMVQSREAQEQKTATAAAPRTDRALDMSGAKPATDSLTAAKPADANKPAEASKASNAPV
jgi:cytoskeletal protein CcmA (bactofilin family)